MRVLLLTKNFPPRSCGVGDYACRLGEELTAAGENVTVLTEPADAPRRMALGLREVPMRGRRDLRPVLSEVAEAEPERVQLEYSAFAWSRWGAAWWVNSLLFRLRRRGIPVHVGLHELAVSMRLHPLQTPLALAQWLHVAGILAAAKTVAVNMRSRAALLERLFPWWREKILYRPNSSTIPLVRFGEAERGAFRRERGVSSGEFVVATFGLFHPAKNYEGLIEAAALLRRSRPVQLWMLGNVAAASPDYVARLKTVAREAGIEKHIWWPGRLDADDVSRALQAADVFVLPQADGHLTRSSAFMAAAAHGLPVVAVRQPGGRDQQEFTHGENVWLVERSAPREIAGALAALLEEPAAAAVLGGNLRRLYEAQFDWPRTADGSITGFGARALQPGNQNRAQSAAGQRAQVVPERAATAGPVGSGKS
jgi:glycosyltransferase involved in cell wall biosynthesis